VGVRLAAGRVVRRGGLLRDRRRRPRAERARVPRAGPSPVRALGGPVRTGRVRPGRGPARPAARRIRLGTVGGRVLRRVGSDRRRAARTVADGAAVGRAHHRRTAPQRAAEAVCRLLGAAREAPDPWHRRAPCRRPPCRGHHRRPADHLARHG
jgi:hypothetical protein